MCSHSNLAHTAGDTVMWSNWANYFMKNGAHVTLISKYPIPFYLGGTSILIVVVVATDTVTQIQTRLMSSQYEQLIKKTKFGR